MGILFLICVILIWLFQECNPAIKWDLPILCLLTHLLNVFVGIMKELVDVDWHPLIVSTLWGSWCHHMQILCYLWMAWRMEEKGDLNMQLCISIEVCGHRTCAHYIYILVCACPKLFINFHLPGFCLPNHGVSTILCLPHSGAINAKP